MQAKFRWRHLSRTVSMFFTLLRHACRNQNPSQIPFIPIALIVWTVGRPSKYHGWIESLNHLCYHPGGVVGFALTPEPQDIRVNRRYSKHFNLSGFPVAFNFPNTPAAINSISDLCGTQVSGRIGTRNASTLSLKQDSLKPSQKSFEILFVLRTANCFDGSNTQLVTVPHNTTSQNPAYEVWSLRPSPICHLY